MSRFTDMLVRDSGKHFLSVSAFAEPASFVPAEQGGDGAGFACTVAVGDDAGSPQDRRSAGLRLDVHQPVFAASIAELRAGKIPNDGDAMAQSTLAGVMGRMSAYTGKEVTWEMALNSKLDTMPKNLAWDMKLDVPPPAMPDARCGSARSRAARCGRTARSGSAGWRGGTGRRWHCGCVPASRA